MRALLLVLVVICASTASRAHGQEDAPPPVAPSVQLTEPEHLGALDAERLATLRLAHREARTTEGVVLLGYGLASIVAGALAAGIGNQDDRWLGFGLGTAGWGLINAIFSIFLFDLGDGRLHQIESDRALRGDALDHAREDWAADQYGTGAVIAVNAGLDVFYIVTGILLFVIADQMAPDLQALQGYGIAMAAQGTGLLAYDLTTWIAASQRGDAARTLFREAEAE
jgi:hypothetical protein